MNPIDPTQALLPIFVGLVATATLDLWALALNRLLGLPMTNWGHVGRWVSLMRSGTFRHAPIGSAPRVAYEQAVGWSTHYLIGVVYAAAYLFLVAALSRTPNLYSAALFGVATLFAPWLVLQPCLGMGYFARNTPRPNLTRVLNVLAHLVFGIGLYIGWTLSPA
jgi:hypothetical protein